uniref:Uncharacterized protein n=1 Tax=Leersia perrieri TaxID=77586 RepID=A0A0D9XRW1_9ORYZ
MAEAARVVIRVDGNDSGGDRDAPRRMSLLVLLLHDMVGVAALVASHPVHAAYALFFARAILSLACFFSPLLLTTSLLLAILLTLSPSPPPPSPLGLTCRIAVGALRAELQPDGINGGGDGAVAVVAQLCSFVLGPGDAAAVLRVGEIMGDIGDDSCFLLQDDDHTDLPPQLHWRQEIPIDGEISTDQDVADETKDGIEEKKVVLELNFPSDNCSSATSDTSLRDMEEQDAIHEQSLVLTEVDGVEEKRLECDPVSVEIRKCEPAPAPAKAKKPCSSVSRRILQWEAQASGNFRSVLEEMEGNSVDLCLEKASVVMDFKECDGLEAGAFAEKCGEKKKVEGIDSVSESVIHQGTQEFKDVKECVQAEPKSCTEKCSKEKKSDETTLVVQSEQECQQENIKWTLSEPELKDEECKLVEPGKEQECQQETIKCTLSEPELQDEECKIVEPVKEMKDQEHKFLHSEEEEHQDQNSKNALQPAEELQDEQKMQDYQEEEFKDADQEDPLISPSPSPSTTIARRVHSRNSSEHHLAVAEGSSPRSGKEKEWKRTLACKLYEERMQLKLCRDRAVVDSGADTNMDMLWEAYEVGGGNGNAASAAAKRKAKRSSSSKNEQQVEETEEEEDEEDEEEGSVRQLCCLQALKFSTRKMNFGGGGKPSLAKISKVLRKMAALSRSGSRRSTKG